MGLTSRAAVDLALKWFPRRTRIGHTGTLDPLATGVLVLCLGGATRLTEYVQLMSKTYRAGLRLGARSDTDDADGAIVPVAGATVPDEEMVTACMAEFVGAIQQIPPAYSAAKVAGQRAYDIARRGEEVTLKARSIVVHSIQILRYDYPHLELEVHCGKGTYIRSLARDLGERLGCGALIETLRRTRVGPFDADEAATLEMDAETARSRLLPQEFAVAELPRLVLMESDLKRLRQGQSVATELLAGVAEGGEVAVFDEANHLVAIGEVDPASKLIRPRKVLDSQSK